MPPPESVTRRLPQKLGRLFTGRNTRAAKGRPSFECVCEIPASVCGKKTDGISKSQGRGRQQRIAIRQIHTLNHIKSSPVKKHVHHQSAAVRTFQSAAVL